MWQYDFVAEAACAVDLASSETLAVLSDDGTTVGAVLPLNASTFALHVVDAQTGKVR